MIDLIFDTDIGGDIDDALALSMALHAKDLNILAVTAVYAGCAWRTGIIRNMLKSYGRGDIPVFAGAERPLFGDWGVERPGENAAARYIAEAAKDKPVTLLVIGPMTNVALALLLSPQIAGNLTICAMGGMLSRAYPEWNIVCDPEAADIVLRSGAKITLVPLDVTEKCTLTKAQALELVAGDSAEMRCLQGEMTRFFEQYTFLPTLHDPLALMCLLSPELCEYEMKDIRVETRGEMTRGVTVDKRYSKDAPIRAAVRVNAEKAVAEISRLVREKQ